MQIRVRTADSLGCAVAGSAVLHSLAAKFRNCEIHVATPFPELFEGMTGVLIERASAESVGRSDVDLRGYTSRRPHNAAPYRASFMHMREMAEEQLSCRLPIMNPRLVLQESEIRWAKQVVAQFAKPVVWLQTKTNSENRNWPAKSWQELRERMQDDFQLIDLAAEHYSLRQSLALTQASLAGLCLDSFLLHGSWAVGAKNVLVLLGSSRTECVIYPGQMPVYSQSRCPAQPCGMHGYAVGCHPKDESAFAAVKFGGCILRRHECMEAISVETVARAFQRMLGSYEPSELGTVTGDAYWRPRADAANVVPSAMQNRT
jgi:hypothetical protein